MKSTAHPRVIERGILTSEYKQKIRQSIYDMKSNSISKIKTSLLGQHEKLQSSTAAILQVSIFTLTLLLVFL